MTSMATSMERLQARLFKVEYCTIIRINKFGESGIQCHSPDHPEYYNTVTIKVRNAKEGVDPLTLENQYEVVIQDFVGNCFGHPWTPRVGDLVMVLFLYNCSPIILGPVNTTYQAPPMRGPTCEDAMYDEVWKWCQWLAPVQDENHDYYNHPKGRKPICEKIFHGPITGSTGKGRDVIHCWDCVKGDMDPTCTLCETIDSVGRESMIVGGTQGEQWFKQYSTWTESTEAYNSRMEWHARSGSYLRFESDDENVAGETSIEYSEGIGHIRLGNAVSEQEKKGHINYHPTGSIDIHSEHEETTLDKEVLGARTLVTGSELELTDSHGTIACESIYLPLKAFLRIYRDGSIKIVSNTNTTNGCSQLYLGEDGKCSLWNIANDSYLEFNTDGTASISCDPELTITAPLITINGDVEVSGSLTHSGNPCCNAISEGWVSY